jgi:hypothetical protein
MRPTDDLIELLVACRFPAARCLHERLDVVVSDIDEPDGEDLARVVDANRVDHLVGTPNPPCGYHARLKSS